MKRFLAIFLILTLVLPTIAGCAQEDAPHIPTGDALYYEGMETAPNQDEEDPQELTLAYYADRSMNPYTCGDFTNRTLFSLIYQGLFSMDSKYNVEPILCSRYSVSGDNMSYTFYIEHNATCSDGSRLDINDVVVRLQTAKESKYYSGRFTHVLDISQTSDNGVRFTLNTPYENLPILLDVPIVKAEEVGLARPLGSGPYYFEESPALTCAKTNPGGATSPWRSKPAPSIWSRPNPRPTSGTSLNSTTWVWCWQIPAPIPTPTTAATMSCGTATTASSSTSAVTRPSVRSWTTSSSGRC